MKTSIISLFLCFSVALFAETITFEKPDFSQGMPVLQAMNLRHSTRDFRSTPIENKFLGDLLWACCGFNREDKRTVPSAMNWQEISVYAVMENGIWRYNGKQHQLELVKSGDFRKLTGMQPFVETAPLNLLFVGDASKCGMAKLEQFGTADAAFCAAHAGLYCASVGLGGVVRGSFQGDALHAALDLPDTMKVLLAMSIGWPK